LFAGRANEPVDELLQRLDAALDVYILRKTRIDRPAT